MKPRPLSEFPRILLEYVLETMTDGALILDEDSLIHYANPRAHQIFDHTRSLVGESLTALMPPEHREGYLRGVRGDLKSGPPDTDWRNIDFNALHGSSARLAVRTSFVMQASDGTRWLVGAVVDLTEQRVLSERLRDEQTRFESWYRQSREALFVHDINGIVLDANPTAEALLGFSLEELRGRSVGSLHEGGAPPIQLVPGQFFHFTTRFKTKSGGSFLAEVQAQKIQVGEGEVYIGSVRDVSEEERLREQVVRTQQMDFVGRLAGGIAHDFNNLLMVIIANSYELSSAVELPEDTRGLLSDTIDAAQEAAGLSAKLMSFARGHMDALEGIHVNKLLQDAERLLRRIAGDNVKMELQLGENVGRSAINGSELTQIVTNLVTNARDAMPEGGTVTIATHSRGGEDNSCNVVQIRDTGGGIPDEIRARIFEPLFTTKPVGTGTGLGLSTIQAILDRRGGSIELESVKGKGCSFEIVLPAESHARDDAAASDSPRGRVLVVDDVPAVRSTIVRMLKRRGFTVVEASDGVQALQCLEAHTSGFSLVITDMMMPNMNGRELCLRIVESYPTMPILLVSAFSADLLPNHLGDRINFLPKPVHPQRFIEVVEKLVSPAAHQRSN